MAKLQLSHSLFVPALSSTYAVGLSDNFIVLNVSVGKLIFDFTFQ
jgi:hypothetical protein